MIEKGAKVNCSNSAGLMPIHYASRNGNVEILSLLLKKGAYPVQDNYFWTPLHYAALHDHISIIERFLQDGNSQLVQETDSQGRTALHVACKQGNLEIVKLLISAGASITHKDELGHVPFYYLNLKQNDNFKFDKNYEEICLSKLSSDFKSLIDNPLNSDIEFVIEEIDEPEQETRAKIESNMEIEKTNLVTNPDSNKDSNNTNAKLKVIPSHRCIIYSRCPTLLESAPPYRILSDNKIQISGITYQLFHAIIEFIYSGSISFEETDLDFVFNLAKKGQEYKFESLIFFAETMIISNLDEDNVISILDAAIAFDCSTRVEDFCRYYIIQHFDPLMTKIPEQTQLLKPDQLLPLFQKLNTSTKIPYHGPIESPPSNLFSSVKSNKNLDEPSLQLNSPNSANKLKQKKSKSPKQDSVIVESDGTDGTDFLKGKNLEIVKKMHKDIMNQTEALAFNTAVDYKSLSLPDYPYIITNPMDLGTILKGFNTKKYPTIRDWARDVRLVWDNALTYNPPQSPIHQFAENLSNYFEKRYINLTVMFGLGPEYDPFNPKPSEWYLERYNTNVKDYQNAIQNTPSTKNETKKPSSGNRQKRKIDKVSPSLDDEQLPKEKVQNLNVLTNEEQEVLQERLSSLGEEQINYVIEMLNVKPNEDGEVEISFDELKPELARKIQQYILDNSKN